MKNRIFKSHIRADDIVSWYTAYLPFTSPWIQSLVLEGRGQQQITYCSKVLLAVRLKMLAEYLTMMMLHFIPGFLKQ